MSDKLPIGTRIRFVKDLTEDATGDHPAFIYAERNTFGVIVGYNQREGYNVLWDGFTTNHFGAELGAEFEAVK